MWRESGFVLLPYDLLFIQVIIEIIVIEYSRKKLVKRDTQQRQPVTHKTYTILTKVFAHLAYEPK